MVTELSRVQFGLKSYAWFQNPTSAQLAELDLKSQVWFEIKLHDTKFDYHFITAILKSQISVSTNIYWTRSRFVKKLKQEGFYISIILYAKQKWCDLELDWCDLEQTWFVNN